MASKTAGGYDAKLVRSFSRIEPQKLGLAVVAGCFAVSLVFMAVLSPPMSASQIPVLRLMMPGASRPMLHVSETSSATRSGAEDRERRNSTTPDNKRDWGALPGRADEDNRRDSSILSSAPPPIMMIRSPDQLLDIAAAAPDKHATEQSRNKPLCEASDPAFDICDLAGDVRILGNSSTVAVVVDDDDRDPAANRSWRVRPYARKGDSQALENVREVLVASLPRLQRRGGSGGGTAPRSCDVHHGVPAVVFSVTGYTGNFFHDFTDVLIPLYLTSRRFDGEVQFVITGLGSWWVNRYKLIFNRLSHHEIVDFDKDDRVHCFPRAIVGLRRHKELTVDPSKPPRGHSLSEFTGFLRAAFALERAMVSSHPAPAGRAPRLMIISRRRTRALVNLRKVVRAARGLGFDVVIGDMNIGSDIAGFARLVNSCDALMGVHGAGLTNLLFLPANGTLIQIVPWGGLEGISRLDFGEPAADAGLRYLEYQITAEESSLVQQYPRDHPVFRDPFSVHRRGWNAVREVFLDKQDVKLDVKRFRAVLLQVLDRLRRW